MDVILDSNQYWNNPKMTGAKFQSLFDYLRKTGGSLVIPRIVGDEVLARHEDELKREYSQAVQSLRTLGKRVSKLAVTNLPALDVAAEGQMFKLKLENPATGVTCIVEPDYSDISLEEVARRGILRKRPASKNGEELRDVILWLATIAYAKNKSQVGFISADAGFRGSDSDLHLDLKEDLVREGVTLHFAVAIDEFVKAHSPTPKLATSEWVDRHLSPEQIAKIKTIFRALAERTLSFGAALLVVSSATEPILQFKRGNLYEVLPGSVYAELEYEGSSVFDLADVSFQFAQPTDYGIPSATITAGQVSVPYQFEREYTTALRSFPDVWARDASGPVQGSLNAFRNFISQVPDVPRTRSVLFSAKFIVSFRVIGDSTTQPEVDSDKFSELSRQVLETK
jgi:hypothetical protein